MVFILKREITPEALNGNAGIPSVPENQDKLIYLLLLL